MKMPLTEKEIEQAKTDACYVSEIINDLNKEEMRSLTGFKYYDLLTSWQKELMEKAGFTTIEEVRAYHALTVGTENW